MRFSRPAIFATAGALSACSVPPGPGLSAPSIAPSPGAAVEAKAAPLKPAAPIDAGAPKPTAPAPKLAAPAKPASPPSTAPAAKQATTAAPRPAAPTLDLKSLEQRLKESDAIGLMTKLSLKNQVDDVVSRFRSYHAGSRPPTLDQLRPSFDLLLMKVLSLLQDKDPKLASDIHVSRDAIWSVLADPAKLAQFS
jgi:hypothetical protein